MTGFPAGEHSSEAGPATSPPGFAVPEFPFLWRGLALGLLSLILGRVAFGSGRTSAFLLPLSFLLGAGAVLAAWAGAIQLTGAVRHDDHPWI